MQETVGTLGAQISPDAPSPVETPPVGEPKKENLVSDPNYVAPEGHAPEPETPVVEDKPEDKGGVEDENPKTLKEILDEKAAHEEEEKRQAELDSKVNQELGVEAKQTEEIQDIENKVEEATKDVEKEVAEKTEELVNIDTKKTELPKEAVDILKKIEDLYKNETQKLKVNNTILETENGVLTDKVKELAKEIATLKGSGATVSNRAIYFDKVMEDGNKDKITDYLLDLLGTFHPKVSKEKLYSLVDKSFFNQTVNADLPQKQVVTKKSKIDTLKSAYSGVYRV